MHYMGLAMAEAFVKQYEHLPDSTALRFTSLCSLALGRYNVRDYDGAFGVLVLLQQLCDVLTSNGVCDVRSKKGLILGMLGGVLLKKGKFNEALTTFERQREFLVAVYGPNSPQTEYSNEMIVKIKKSIGIGERGNRKGDSAAELVVARQRLKESHESVDISYRFYYYMRLVDALKSDGRHQESLE